ncbi:MAG: 2-phosphosulfolactate phosphatase [Bacteroidetes bacterium]|nr:2-phosphosulfolactate phosphatase [Bacteroidota bacterium]
MRTIEVVFTPALLPLYEAKGKIVVVIDILRATSTMCVAFQTGVKRILPVSSVEECKIFKDFDFIISAERNAVKVEGFDMGNSPFEYQNPLLAGKSIAFTTTNGTKAIKLSQKMEASQIVIGSFLNIDVLCDWLINQNQSVILLCSGWKDKYNIEDTLFAGAVLNQIKQYYIIECDAALSSEILYETSKNDIENIVRKSSHSKRFTLLNSQTDDVKFCLQKNLTPILPLMRGEYLML